MSKELIEQLAKEHDINFYEDPQWVSKVALITAAQLEAMCKAYAQTQGQSIPDGWKLVPIEPTDAMNMAGFESIEQSSSAKMGMKWQAMCAYKAMLNAAPIESGVKG